MKRAGNWRQDFLPQDQINRIMAMEEIFDQACSALNQLGKSLNVYEHLLPEIARLESYYESGQWLEDMDDDAVGIIPADLKRGVLSEDGIWDLLVHQKEVFDQMAEVLEKSRKLSEKE